MSLVNKMLRDLDARRASEAERGALPAAITPLSARRETAAPWPKRIAILLFLIAGAILAAWQWRKQPQPPVATPLLHAESAPIITAPAPDHSLMPPPAASVLAETSATKNTQPAASKVDVPAQKHSAPATTAPSKTSPTPPTDGIVKASPNATPSPSLISPPPPNTGNPKTISTPHIEKQEHLPSPMERAEAIYQSGREAQRAGRLEDALAQYQAALVLAPEHAAPRQALVGLLIDVQRWDAAEKVLRDGIDLPATRLASTLTLARLFVERNKIPAALDLMQQQAASGEKSAEYQGFLAVLLNRAGRAHESAEKYQAAIRLAPNEARWWAGLGIALESDGQNAAAQNAYLKARSMPGLPPELSAYVEQKLR
ncbi:MAG TPA: tetratricopeptide repeat protein [Rugosibacter sp.]